MLNVIAVFNVIRVDPTTGHAVWTGLTGTRSALERDGFTIDPNSMSHRQRDWFDKHGYLDAESRARIRARGESENEAETLNAIAIRPNTRHAVVDRARRNSNLEPRAVSRKSVLSMRSRGSVDSEIPLRGYFLSVGGVLFALLCAAGWLMPGPPPKGSIDPDFESVIRIHSELKGPELVVIDTNQPIAKMPAEQLE